MLASTRCALLLRKGSLDPVRTAQNAKTGSAYAQNEHTVSSEMAGRRQISALGDNCQTLAIMPAWDSVLARGAETFAPRASHKGVLVDNEVWVLGGVEFEPYSDAFEIAVYNTNKAEWRKIRSVNTPPLPRYDHAVAVHKVNSRSDFKPTS